VLGVCGFFQNLVFNVRSTVTQTSLVTYINAYACKEFILVYEKEIGRRERRKGMKFLECGVVIRMEFRTNNVFV